MISLVVQVVDLGLFFTSCQSQVFLSSFDVSSSEIVSVVNNNNEPDDDDDDDDSKVEVEVEDRFNRVWPKLQAKLCPLMVPNITLGKSLFAAARHELGLVIENNAKHSTSMYMFDDGGWVYTPPPNITQQQPILYVKIWKAANNQIRYWSKKELKLQKNGSSFKQFRKLTHPELARRNITLSSLQNACIVTAIRDPVSHFLSGYNEIDTRLIVHPERLTDPHPLLFTRYKNGTQQRFEQFVVDFVGNLGLPRVGVDPEIIEIGHVYSMVGVLHKLLELHKSFKLTSYLPTISNLTIRWPQFLAETCPALPKSLVKPMENMDDKKSLSDPYGYHTAARTVWNQGGITSRAICAIHAMDYACFGDRLPDGIPHVCQDVFSSNVFVDRVMMA